MEFDLMIQFSAGECDPARGTRTEVQETDVWCVCQCEMFTDTTFPLTEETSTRMTPGK